MAGRDHHCVRVSVCPSVQCWEQLRRAGKYSRPWLCFPKSHHHGMPLAAHPRSWAKPRLGVLCSRVRGDRPGIIPQLCTVPVSCRAVPCHRALVGPSGGPSVPRLGVGTGEHRKARTMSATTAHRVRGEVEAERHLWFPLKLKGPIIFQEAGGVNEPLQSRGGSWCVLSWPVCGG